VDVRHPGCRTTRPDQPAPSLARDPRRNPVARHARVGTTPCTSPDFSGDLQRLLEHDPGLARLPRSLVDLRRSIAAGTTPCPSRSAGSASGTLRGRPAPPRYGPCAAWSSPRVSEAEGRESSQMTSTPRAHRDIQLLQGLGVRTLLHEVGALDWSGCGRPGETSDRVFGRAQREQVMPRHWHAGLHSSAASIAITVCAAASARWITPAGAGRRERLGSRAPGRLERPANPVRGRHPGEEQRHLPRDRRRDRRPTLVDGQRCLGFAAQVVGSGRSARRGERASVFSRPGRSALEAGPSLAHQASPWIWSSRPPPPAARSRAAKRSGDCAARPEAVAI